MSRIIKIELDDKNFDLLSFAATSEKKELSEYIEYAALKFALNDVFVSDEEMVEIEEIFPGLDESLNDVKEGNFKIVQ